ncbi:Replication factor C, subunit 5 [Giardia muris]|uniref:Replication factor C, subunit 5 n=1 Tax=Giardia muris TaxID=5742 RepID=A0A4Z1SVN4_GIAMU|nr:Replication factor C, subunit 5 [Giardia muris]|eukprot:TNJ29834.1 Replication factor C, subunit 5 [Giardia muris]
MWCTRFTPQTLEELDYHPEANELFTHMARTTDLPHLLVYGPPGSGRHTRVMALIRAIYAVKTLEYVPSTIVYETASDKNEINVISTACHLELNPSEVGAQDVYIIQTVIRETASTASVDNKFKIIVLQDAGKLTFVAQQALRRLMEQHASTCKLIFITESLSGLIPPIVSRCFCIRVPGFTTQEIIDILRNTVDDHKLMRVSDELIEDVAHQARGNLRRAFLILQSFYYASAKRTVDISDLVPEWELRCREIGNYCGNKNLKPEQLEKIRGVLVQILKQAIPPDLILAQLYFEFKRAAQRQGLPTLLHQIVQSYTEYDCRLVSGSNPLYHLEAFAICCITAEAQG